MAIGWSLMTVVAFVGRYERWVTEEEAEARFSQLWVPPFVRYYFTSEFEAGANLAGKLIVFSILGFLFGGWVTSLKTRSGIGWSGVVVVLWTILLGATIEYLQVWLLPFIPDANDVLIYALGAVAGSWSTVCCSRPCLPRRTPVKRKDAYPSAAVTLWCLAAIAWFTSLGRPIYCRPSPWL